LNASEEIEQLQNRRIELETESKSLEEQQKDLEERTKILEEKIAIEELRKVNKTKQDAIDQLKAKLDELEQRLKNTSETPESHEPSKETIPEIISSPPPATEEVTAEVAELIGETPEEETVTVGALEDPMVAQEEELSEHLKRQSEKKKRRLF
jgi:uncharacterized coiled-coil protein SlyX